MMKCVTVSLILLIFFCHTSMSKSLSEKRVIEIDRLVNSHIKHTVKTIKSENGEVIDCVPLHKQPAFSHPSLKNHKIKMGPSVKLHNTKATVSSFELKQEWHKYGSCPEGTIPIRRANATIFAKSNLPIEHFGKKPQHLNQTLPKGISIKDTVPFDASRAFMFTAGYAYGGGTANMKVYSPRVQFDDEYSLGNVAAVNGDGPTLEQVESGWAVHPTLYGDRAPHFFVYFKAAAGKKIPGCFDLTCPGFIQTTSQIALGAAISKNDIPIPGGLTDYLNVWLARDVYERDWWVWVGGNQYPLGYYPAELFDVLSFQASEIQWGGEVGSTRIRDVKPHTETEMGDGWKDNCLMRGVKILSNNNDRDWILPKPTRNIVDEINCYSVTYRDDLADPLLLYGGSGKYCSPIRRNQH